MHRIRFRLGLCPIPRRGAYSAPQDPLAGFKGPRSKRRGRKERRELQGRGRREGRGPTSKSRGEERREERGWEG